MFAKVAVDAIIGGDNKAFDYIIPDGMLCKVGSRVVIPFGKRELIGFILSIEGQTEIEESLLKSIICTDDFFAIKPELIALLPEICNKFKLRYNDALHLFVPGAVRGRKIKAKKNDENLIRHATGEDDKKVILTPQQQNCAEAVSKGQGGEVFVLHGVTGSGKTEVYMNIIQHVLDNGRTALVLVPEIGLTPQVLSNFRARFGDTVAMLHSGLGSGERFNEWKRVYYGEAKIIIGARSAVFAPVENIGVIIIDEEHDGSYQSENNPRYFTHDIAIMRARYNNCPLVLGSATPSVDTYYKTQNTISCGYYMGKKYNLLKLPKRISGGNLAPVEIVDMRNEIHSGNGGIFSRAFLQSLFETLRAGRSAMIFLNRRGYSQSVRCMGCGWVAACSNCDVALVYHKEEKKLKCHYCGAGFSVPAACPDCGGHYIKYGVMGTQKAADELSKLLKDGGLDIPILRMDTDSTKNKGNLAKILHKFANTVPSILVGTQMIAKGHHFPSVDIVGVIDADSGLNTGDYRAAERTFSLLTQVAGRAGREADSHGKVFIQTYRPFHYVYKFVKEYDYNGFYEREINSRAVTEYPPFSVIVRVLISGISEIKIKTVIDKVMKCLRAAGGNDFLYLGSMKCPHGRLKNKFRYQVVARMKTQYADKITKCADKAVKLLQSGEVQMFLEINPNNLS
jgi:primosomal protein N' (replication factor Y)